MNEKGKTFSIFAVRISPHGIINIAVESGEPTRRFTESFPDALAHGSVWFAADAVAEVHRQIDLVKPKEQS